MIPHYQMMGNPYGAKGNPAAAAAAGLPGGYIGHYSMAAFSGAAGAEGYDETQIINSPATPADVFGAAAAGPTPGAANAATGVRSESVGVYRALSCTL